MGRRVEVRRNWAARVPDSWEGWAALSGAVVARSGTTSTTRCATGDIAIYLKRYGYPLRVTLRASLRNTFRRPSRARKEFENLRLLRSRVGEDAAPPPIAIGEARTLGFLREAFLATEALPGASPLSEILPGERRAPERLGRFLARIHGAGIVHGSLFARNVISDGERFAVVDLDKCRFSGDGRPFPLTRRARDLAFLEASLCAVPIRTRLQVLYAYLNCPGMGGAALREVLDALEQHREEAVRRLARREQK